MKNLLIALAALPLSILAILTPAQAVDVYSKPDSIGRQGSCPGVTIFTFKGADFYLDKGRPLNDSKVMIGTETALKTCRDSRKIQTFIFKLTFIQDFLAKPNETYNVIYQETKQNPYELYALFMPPGTF